MLKKKLPLLGLALVVVVCVCVCLLSFIATAHLIIATRSNNSAFNGVVPLVTVGSRSRARLSSSNSGRASFLFSLFHISQLDWKRAFFKHTVRRLT